MEMLLRMNECIGYIEENLQGTIEMEELARLTYSSKFHFQRMFNMLTGFTVAEYIRKRRLTLAAQELSNSGAKVIDVALRYGYETPESFSKAFRRAHGVSPSQVRNQEVSLKAFPRISFQIQLKGEKEMNYRIVEKEGFKAAGIGKKVSAANGENNKEIPVLWDEVNRKGLDREICEAAGAKDLLGICMEFDHPKEEFTYFIGAHTDKPQEKFEVKEIPASTWAVFESVGPMPQAIQNVWQRIYSEWFPSTGYEHGGGPEFELYPPGDIDDENYRCEVWIPIRKK
ncbi:AraC family transcriptional regulator [Rossellomorea vietnamensis]|uniref:AraC family transcriptional regulator n=1 Tax=Rossellomorea vietnamensis TaxID=218284 RepID=A0A5D4KCL1_9BACI|nr:AraC family transcriptional regulator [Rossellomorea vietnamensis]TYR74676.1 AraC family transcriptional regulator [Rossellomorea vietnamensis]